MNIVTIHLMYHTNGKIRPFVDVDEEICFDKAEDVKDALQKILILMHEPYKYDVRVELADGSYFAMCTDGCARIDKKISIRYSERWNSHGDWQRKTRSEVKKMILAAYEKQVDC